jgi:hypothetical protein
MTMQQPYNPGTGDTFHSQEEIYQDLIYWRHGIEN